MNKLTALIGLLFTLNSSGQFAEGELRFEDKVRIREAMIISDSFGEKIWTGISKVPFTVLLVTDSTEFLINHPAPSDDFKLLGYDSILNTKVFYRPASFDKKFLATFPAVNGVNCIVAGTPENTGVTSTAWIITLLHEHFHQYQYTYPDYYKSVDKLDLSGGDQTGMWMLNYPFPYKNDTVIQQYNKYSAALLSAVSTTDEENFGVNFKTYENERNKLKALLSPADYSYFSFQLWQEGIARYTEYKFLQLLENYVPSKEVTQLPDYKNFKSYEQELYNSQLKHVKTQSLKEDQRVCFYAIGCAEGILLDKLNPDWRDSYLTDKFYLENYRKKK